MKSGVPQGSILGPLLFILYINDIATSCDTINIDLYADDSTLFESGYITSEIQSSLQNKLNAVEKWCSHNNMSIHPNKTKCMLIGTRSKIKSAGKLTLNINGITLDNVIVQKLLGVFIDNTLNWQAQIDYVCKKINAKISLLKHIIFYIDNDMKNLFYNSYILPVFDYCCTIWGKDNKRYINKIYKLQKRVAKIILNKPLRSPTIGLLKELNWLSFSDRCKYHAGVLVFKALNNMAPNYLSELLTLSNNDNYSLRSMNNCDLVVKRKYRTNLYQDSFTSFSMKIWNDIPTSIRKSYSLHTFKNNFKLYLHGQSNR